MRLVLLSFIVLISCATTVESIPSVEDSLTDATITEENKPQDEEISTEIEEIENSEPEYPYLSSLSDTYYNRRNAIPEAFSRIKEEIEEEVDLFEGYRVQIYSGPDVALADTAAKRFRAWSAAYIKGYQASTYTEFRAPNYRVHVGDFHDRKRAIDFSNLIKRRFRDSWVVYDRVNPFNVPTDTTQILYSRN